MGSRLQDRRGPTESGVVARLTALYLAVFTLVIAALSVLAFVLIDNNYRDALEPVLTTPEGGAVFARFERQALTAIAALDAALLLIVGLSSYALARAAVRPLVVAREREERFAADAAHELRTPLSVIASVAQAARDGGRHDAALATITEHALDAGRLVGDLLTLARNPDSQALTREPADLAAIVNKALDGARASHPQVTFDAELTSAIVDGDAHRLMQLARNLLENAARHARSRVAVTVESADREARFIVQDDGPGVSADVRARLFQRFAKGSDSRGSGLGLAICRWVARSHGGDVVHAGGSRFVANLPLTDYDSE